MLEDFSLTLPSEGVTALCGPSGCGKTTLMRLIAGLETADAGTINGLDGAKISMVFQEDRLLPGAQQSRISLSPLLGQKQPFGWSSPELQMRAKSYRMNSAAVCAGGLPSPVRWPTQRLFCWMSL